MIKVLVVDDSALMRRLLCGILQAQGDMDVSVARDGEEALARLHALRPDVMKLDVNMPGMGGLACLDRIMLERPCPVATQYEKLDEIPFDFERRRVSIVLKRGTTPTEERLLIAKGSPEGIESICGTYEVGEKILEFDAAARAA